MDKPKDKENRTPLAILHEIANDPEQLLQARLDAAKALLPYTAKKTAETLETTNLSITLDNANLKALDNNELGILYTLLKKLTDFGSGGTGTPEAEIQPV